VDHLDHFGQTLFWLYLLIPGFWKASLLVSGWILDISLYFRREIPLGYSIGVELSFLKILVIFVMLAYNWVDHKKGITFSSTRFYPLRVSSSLLALYGFLDPSLKNIRIEKELIKGSASWK
jgi:hypothetical protein